MDLGDVTQLALLATSALVFGRVGLAFARWIEHRAAGPSAFNPEAEARLRGLEEECSMLRQELSEVQERQDFTERTLLQDPAQARAAGAALPRERFTTPR